MCETVIDHEWGPERIVGYVDSPIGRLAKVEQRCDHCDRVRRSVKRSDVPAYAAAIDRVQILPGV